MEFMSSLSWKERKSRVIGPTFVIDAREGVARHRDVAVENVVEVRAKMRFRELAQPYFAAASIGTHVSELSHPHRIAQ
jgi:hypothetical protein